MLPREPHVDMLPRPRVLAADDNIVNLRVLRLLLRRLNADMTLVSDGQAAVDAATEPGAEFDVVLLDRHMPRMEGGPAALAIRTHAASHWTREPVILGVSGDSTWGMPCEDLESLSDSDSAVSASVMSALSVECDPETVAFDGFLAKPVLLSALQVALHRHRPDLVCAPVARRGSIGTSPFGTHDVSHSS
jgi:CheY-like chemotaxis protein